ncbi:pseudouridine synthase [Tothia fuscella]|uniref:tRNA pseudouridine(55) synthase n=1 Tax=Tothia fuscella TaxID=1048955 RepID=A0A9P4U2K3_9PEZI|nr:pseudouridine synthase [Tothia fuscella]
MASSSSQPILEGAFAIHKPPAITSFDVIRTLQTTFKSSHLFDPLLSREKDKNLKEPRTKSRHKRDKKDLNLKIGHGGTLDPLATGVLIIGVGSGTKSLPTFLECTKSYDCVVLFGCATDSYDAVGKIVGRAEYAHITKGMLEEALEKFRGEIMQTPPVFSALRVNGKRMHEYAREGGEVPKLQARPVSCTTLELVEWLPPGSHGFGFPTEDASKEQRAMAEKLMGIAAGGWKRKGTPSREEEAAAAAAAGAGAGAISTTEPGLESETKPRSRSATPKSTSNPPAARLRMTVTSGFYVRSLCHDLGAAVDSLAIMSSLIRTRQGDFDIHAGNVLPYEDLKAGEKVWGPKVQSMLESWQAKEGNVVESVEDGKGRDESVEGDGKREKKQKVHPWRGRSKERRNSSSVDA